MDCIERDFLISHLYDIRALETLKNKLSNSINDNNNIIKHLGFSSYYKKPGKGMFLFIAWLLFAVPTVSCFVMNSFFESYLFEVGPYYNKEPIWDDVNFFVLIVAIITVLALVVSTITISLVYAKKKHKYNVLISEDTERVKRESAKKEELNSINEKYAKDLREINNLLVEVYSANIVPMQFRNLHGICYLYDFMSTCNESFESAIFNFNINSMNDKLSVLIEQQAQMILQQYTANMCLSNVQSNQCKMLEKLSNIENNSELNAKYSAIISSNTNTIKFFERCEFYKNL